MTPGAPEPMAALNDERPGDENARLYKHTLKFFFRFVSEHLDDPEVSEIMINGPKTIYYEKKGKLFKSSASFPDEDSLRACVINLSQFVGRTITEETTRFDARFPDGHRVHVMLPPCARNGICIAIRKFSPVNFKIADLVRMGSMSAQAAEYLALCVQLGKNIFISGGTGSGKTSMLNAMSGLIPADERILVLEDTNELQLQQEHVLYFESVAGDREGRGRVTIRDLFHSALRMRPSRIVIGEIRSGEALDLIQAMTTGHSGSMSTIHANNPVDALSRFETLCLMGGLDLPLRVIRSQVASALDVIVQINRFRSGARKMVEVAEVGGLDEARGAHTLNPVFCYDHEANGGQGRLSWTGRTSFYAEELRLQGMAPALNLTRELFAA